MNKDLNGTGTWQEYHVCPEESEYIMYVPKFFYFWNTFIHTTLFFESLTLFRNHYIQQLSGIEKNIPISYITRSRKENYRNNYRDFINRDEFEQMLDSKKVHMINTDNFSSLTPQFQDIVQSKIIIVEMGSAFTINASFFASNSHFIIINDMFNYHYSDYPFFHIIRKLMEERNNTVEIFSYGVIPNPININIHEFNHVLDKITMT
jgi:hypothetical protein